MCYLGRIWARSALQWHTQGIINDPCAARSEGTLQEEDSQGDYLWYVLTRPRYTSAHIVGISLSPKYHTMFLKAIKEGGASSYQDPATTPRFLYDLEPHISLCGSTHLGAGIYFLKWTRVAI